MPTIPLDAETGTVALLAPAFEPGASLEDALMQRRSERSFSRDALPLQTLSALLWAGCGINRRASGHRTAPSAHNWQEVSVFAVMAEGAYRYEPAAHRLRLVDTRDLRSVTGLQDFVGTAPLNLVYVADQARMHECKTEELGFFAGADAAFVAQNISLYCASAGLATVVRAMVDRRRLAAALSLSVTERIALAQTVGLPAPGP